MKNKIPRHQSGITVEFNICFIIGIAFFISINVFDNLAN